MTHFRLAPILIATAFLFSTPFALAQEAIYKGVDAKGNIVYSNSPKGLQKSQKVQLPEPALTLNGGDAPQAQPSTNRGDARGDRDNKNRLDEQPKALPKSEPANDRSSYIDANNVLKAAIKAQETGVEPLPSERLGTAGGGSRLSPAYFARQDALAKAVSEARAKLNGTTGQ